MIKNSSIFTNAQNWQYLHPHLHVFPFMCNILLYLHHMMLRTVKLYISGYYKWTTF